MSLNNLFSEFSVESFTETTLTGNMDINLRKKLDWNLTDSQGKRKKSQVVPREIISEDSTFSIDPMDFRTFKVRLVQSDTTPTFTTGIFGSTGKQSSGSTTGTAKWSDGTSATTGKWSDGTSVVGTSTTGSAIGPIGSSSHNNHALQEVMPSIFVPIAIVIIFVFIGVPLYLWRSRRRQRQRSNTTKYVELKAV